MAASAARSSSSDSDSDAQAFQLPRSATKPPHPPPQPEFDVESSESESESEKVKGKATAAAAGEKSKAEQERKMPAPEAAPSSKAKKRELQRASMGCAGVGGSPAPPAPTLDPPLDADKAEATPAGKGNKAEAQNAAPEPTPSGKGRRRVARTSPKRSSSHCRSIKEDDWTIMEAYVEFFEREGPEPSTEAVLSAVENQLSSEKCYWGPADIYQTVERFWKKYKTGSVPSEEDEFKMYKLLERVWGNTEKVAATATTSQNDGAVKKSKKGQANKEKMDGNSKGGVPKEAVASTTNQNGL